MSRPSGNQCQGILESNRDRRPLVRTEIGRETNTFLLWSHGYTHFSHNPGIKGKDRFPSAFKHAVRMDSYN